MKQHPGSETNPLRVRAETLRHLRRGELATVGGGSPATNHDKPDCSTDPWTMAGQPTTGTTAAG